MAVNHPSIAIAHKDYDVRGGGEVLAEQLARTFDAAIYTGFVNHANRGDLTADVRGLFQDGVKGKLLRRGGLPRQLIYQFEWEVVPDLLDYDVVIQSGNEPLWYVPPDTQTTIAYTHSTPRVQYDLNHRLMEQKDTWRGKVGQWLAQLYNRKVRRDYYPNTRYPDLFVANSELVARRINKYWNVPKGQIRVVHPPVPTHDLGPEHARDELGDFYFSVNRLDEWKRIDEIVDAFADLDQRLIIAGTGSEEEALKKQAQAAGADNIEFVGFISEAEKRTYLASAKALVYNPLNEDFGMVPVEALASGTPVISVRDGYQRWQLDHGETGLLYDRDVTERDITVRNLRMAVRDFEADGVAADTDELQFVAGQYSVENFEAGMREAVREARSHARVDSFEECVLPGTDGEPRRSLDSPDERAIADGGGS